MLRAGLAATLAAGLIGWGIERARFGTSDESALARVQSELRDRLDAAADSLGAIAARVTVSPDALRTAPRNPSIARSLFEQASTALTGQEPGRTGITIYGSDGTPLAWAGRVFDLPKERLFQRPALFVGPG